MNHRLARRLRQRMEGDQGFSLVELSVALVVMAIVFAALGAFLITSVAAQQRNEQRAQAVQVAQQTLEEGRALPWDLLGFYADDAGATACGTTDGPTVSLTVPANAADRSTRVPTSGAKTVTVEGQDYTRTACYRWIDDPIDGTGTADSNGTEDVKRIEVDVAWTTRDQTFQHRVEALRAPTAAEVAPRSAAGQPFGITSVTPPANTTNTAAIDSTGNLTAPLALGASTTAGVSTVQVRWTDGVGASQVRTLTASGSSTSWSTTLPLGTGPFVAAATTFTFTAYASTGETSTQNTTVTFSQAPGSLNVSTTATPNSVDINTSGVTAVAFTVTATTNAAAGSAILSWKNRSGSVVTTAMTKQSDTSFTHTFPANSAAFPDGGVTFTASATGGGGTASSGTTVTFVPPAIVPVSVVGATATPELCVENSSGDVLRPTVLSVQVEGLATSDVVTLQFNDAAGSRVNAVYQSTSGSVATYAYTVPSGGSLDFKNKSQFAVSALATRSADNTQATKIYNFPISERNGNETCPPT